MALNKQKGNMFGFINYTWNPIKGKCIHNCKYCYMKRIWNMMKDNTLRLDHKDLDTNLGRNNYIFVGSSTDIMAANVNTKWIERVIDYCSKFPSNTYLFQSKNPCRFQYHLEDMPENMILSTTIESNLDYNISEAPSPCLRYLCMNHLTNSCGFDKLMVTIEPIMDFDVEVMIKWIKDIKPIQVNIGADSKNSGLVEPSEDKIRDLLDGIRPVTKIYLKRNLGRLLN